MSLTRTGIEYLDFLWQIATGCTNWRNPDICGGGGSEFSCWAKGLIEGRLKRFYPQGFEPTFYSERINDPVSRRNPSVVGVGFMGDLFCGSFPVEQVQEILGVVRETSRHTYVFLTKSPWELMSYNPWPSNAWVGASVTNAKQYAVAIACLALVQARVKFLSFEPLLEAMPIAPPYMLDDIHWIIEGAATKPSRLPEKVWVTQLIQAANRADVPVFIKGNMRSIYPPLLRDKLRQEMPR